MPTVRFRGETIECEEGAVLRNVLLDAGETPHNGTSHHLNCRGNGICGTCAVELDGTVSDRNAKEESRLSKPPHDLECGLRLACQARVLGDVAVEKHDGFWGQKVNR